jgi:hypothetical protein
VDLYFWRDQLALKTDIFDFANQRLKWPRVRTSLQFTFLQHLYLNAGVDDIFNRPIYSQLDNRVLAGRDFLPRGGIVFTDDDLKALIPVVPAASGDSDAGSPRRFFATGTGRGGGRLGTGVRNHFSSSARPADFAGLLDKGGG